MEKSEETSTTGRRRVHVAPLVVLASALAVTAIGAGLTRSSNNDTETRRLEERVEAAATVFMGSLPGLTAPLAGAAALAEETDAEEAALRGFLEPQVGDDLPFDSVSIWRVGQGDTGPVLVVGTNPQLAALPDAEEGDFLDRTVAADDLAVLDLIDAEVPAVGYALTVPGAGADYVVYAENALPPNRTDYAQAESPFRDLDYALYLGSDETTDALLIAHQPDLPLDGRTERTSVPFGDSGLLLVLRPQGDLAGPLAGRPSSPA